MKKIICLTLALIMLLASVSLLSSCGDKTDGGTQELPKLPIIENGATEYTIVYAQSSEAASAAAVTLKSKIRTVTSVKMESLSEDEAREAGIDEDDKLILIGNTSFEASATVIDSFANKNCDEYAIENVGDDIVIVGNFDSSLETAVNYYADNLIESNYDGSTLLFVGFRFEGRVIMPTGFDMTRIGEYSIVYASEPPALEAAAEQLKKAIKTKTGADVNVYKDTDKTETPLEIVLGETNRTISRKAYDNDSRIMEFEVIVSRGQVQLAVGGAFSARKCVEKFSASVLTFKDETLPQNSYYKTDLAPDSFQLTAGADVRIMSANVLSYNWGEEDHENVLPVAERCEMFVGVLYEFQPDAVGVQEADAPWLKVLPSYLEHLAEKDGVEYTYLFGEVSNGGKTVSNYTSIVYRSDKYKLDESGCKVFTNAGNPSTYTYRVGSYVKLTSKTDSSIQFALVNTHYAHEEAAYVESCATQQAAIVNELKSKYPNIPVFSTGDYNSHKYDGIYLDKFVDFINGQIGSKLALSSGALIKAGGYHTSASKLNEGTLRTQSNSNYNIFIDHIVCAGSNYQIKRHDTILSNYTHVMTDHSPIYADFDITK